MVDNKKNEGNESKPDVDQALEHVLKILREQNDQGLTSFILIDESSKAAKLFGFYDSLAKRAELLEKILLSPEDKEFEARLEKNAPKKQGQSQPQKKPEIQKSNTTNDLPTFAPEHYLDRIDREKIEQEEREEQEKKIRLQKKPEDSNDTPK